MDLTEEASGSSTMNPFLTALDLIVQKSIVYFSLDMETGGPVFGILQFSIVAVSMDGTVIDTFNEYVKPPEMDIWLSSATEVSGLHKNHPSIWSAKPIEEVWPRFEQFIKKQLDGGNKKGIVVAWNGAASDMDYIFRATKISHKDKLNWPHSLDFFLDPCHVILHYKSCKLNEMKQEGEGHGLAAIWCHIKNQETMESAHDNLVDARAQCGVLFHKDCVPFIDKKFSIQPIASVWTKKMENKAKQEWELTRPVPVGWTEDNTTSFELPREENYSGPDGGPSHGPTKVQSCKTSHHCTFCSVSSSRLPSCKPL